MSDTQTIADLRAARALIEKGWTRGYYERDGRYCLSAAIREVAPDNYPAMGNALRLTLGYASLTRWNDAQPSKKPVLAAIDATIARLEVIP